MARVHIHIVGTNQKQYLPRLLTSLRAQTFRDFQILFIDNASQDGSIDLIREKFPEVVCLKNTNNLGSAAAHNQGFQLALSKWSVSDLSDRFVVLMNPEMVAATTMLAELVATAERSPEAGVIGPKILRMFATEGLDRELERVDQSEILDSTGLLRAQSGKLSERGAGEDDRGQYPAGEVWGFSGAALMYRAEALEMIREGDAIFDTDFHSFGEDVDVAWRLRRAGWKAVFEPKAVVYRYCGAFEKTSRSLWAKLKARRALSPSVRFFQHRNHLLMQVKNIGLGESLKTMYRWVPREIGNFFRMLVIEPGVLWKVSWSFLGLVPKMIRKRSMIRQLR